MSGATNAADERFKAFMIGNLGKAAETFGVTVVGEPRFGWFLRSVSARAEHPGRGVCWLRVHTESFVTAGGETWTGNTDAEQITAVAKPHVLKFDDWDDQTWGRSQRAELTTFVRQSPASDDEFAPVPLEVPSRWWGDLRQNLRNLAPAETERRRVTQAEITRRIRVFWGDLIDPTVRDWRCAHGDLHWSNITAPEVVLLDWEHWGMAPLGYDPATLLSFSLLNTSAANEVRAEFAEELDSRDGRIAQLTVIARLLLRAEAGEFPELVAPLHRQAQAALSGLRG
ncbi:phosphotransferase [Glycomyces xiaoerkulensis]|uniref:phosphotransferase n=1 Tax=Glycomyces xiaoerkulensis TaxID=2038139 RepID=UPI0018E4B704|nr:phosphotransferase [Glycomyces xiaoerkulensis]